MVNCPLCGASVVYVGMTNVECSKSSCVNYTKNPTLGEIRAVWVKVPDTFTSTPMMYWAAEDVEVNDPVTNIIGDPWVVKKAQASDYILGTCVFFARYHTQEEAYSAYYDRLKA